MAIGVTTGAYALSLLATSTLQIQQDRALIADRHPVDVAITVLGDDHDQMESRLQQARIRYANGADGYSALITRLDTVRERLAKMDRTVTSIERASGVLAASIPGIPDAVRSSARGSTGGGGSAGSGASAPRTVPAAPPAAAAPPTSGSTGASGKP